MRGEAGPRGGLGGPPQKSCSTLCPALGPTLLMSPFSSALLLTESHFSCPGRHLEQRCRGENNFTGAKCSGRGTQHVGSTETREEHWGQRRHLSPAPARQQRGPSGGRESNGTPASHGAPGRGPGQGRSPCGHAAGLWTGQGLRGGET